MEFSPSRRRRRRSRALLKFAATGGLKPGSVVVCTLTGHGLKDPDTALKNLSNTIVVEPDIGKVLKILQGG